MDIDPEPVGVESDRLLDPLDPVDRVQRRMGVEHHLTAAVDRAPPCGEQLIDIGLLDLVSAKLDLDIGDIADQAAGPNVAHTSSTVTPDMRSASSRLRAPSLASMSADVAALDAAAFTLAGAEHAQAPVVVRRDDQRTDFRRADVSAAIRICSSGEGTLGSAFLGRFGRDQFPGLRGSRTVIWPGLRRSNRTGRGR
jgi:hypothetical protein